LDFKVLFVHPLENGLKAYVKVDEKIYYITFQTKKNSAEFTVYSEDEKDKLLRHSKLRQELLNKFMLFLKQHKDDIKVGIYIDESPEAFNKIFRLNKLEKVSSGSLDVKFSILDDQYSITNLIVMRRKNNIFIDDSRAHFNHINKNCFCENIKHNHGIGDFEHCLVLIEHLDTILKWIKEEYKKRYISNKTSNIIQFPTN
jgi:dsDNA-binding SOS-regulon protein